MKFYILTFEIKDLKIPKIVAMYLINNEEWDEIREYLERDFYVYINDKSFCENEIEVSKETLSYNLNDNIEHIEAFKTLFKNYFGTYDVLSILREKAFEKNNDKKKKKLSIEDVFGDEEEQNDDLNYYLMTKKNTPEFSGIDDDKVMEYINEAKKVMEQFKIQKNNIKG